MKTFFVDVTQTVKVELDETKFTDEFFDEFNRYITDYGTDLSKHAKHLAQLEARGMMDFGDSLIEGYGHRSEFGITTSVVDQWEEIIEDLSNG